MNKTYLDGMTLPEKVKYLDQELKKFLAEGLEGKVTEALNRIGSAEDDIDIIEPKVDNLIKLVDGLSSTSNRGHFATEVELKTVKDPVLDDFAWVGASGNWSQYVYEGGAWSATGGTSTHTQGGFNPSSILTDIGLIQNAIFDSTNKLIVVKVADLQEFTITSSMSEPYLINLTGNKTVEIDIHQDGWTPKKIMSVNVNHDYSVAIESTIKTDLTWDIGFSIINRYVVELDPAKEIVTFAYGNGSEVDSANFIIYYEKETKFKGVAA